MTVNKDKTGQHSTVRAREEIRKYTHFQTRGYATIKDSLTALRYATFFDRGLLRFNFILIIFFFCYFLLKIYARLLFSFRFLSSSLNIFKLCVRTTPQEIMMSSICETTFLLFYGFLLQSLVSDFACLARAGPACEIP